MTDLPSEEAGSALAKGLAGRWVLRISHFWVRKQFQGKPKGMGLAILPDPLFSTLYILLTSFCGSWVHWVW